MQVRLVLWIVVGLIVALGVELVGAPTISLAAQLPSSVKLGPTLISNIALNGTPGTELTVAPNTNVTITANWSVSYPECPSCLVNVPVAVRVPPDQPAQPAGCLEERRQSGQSGTGAVALGPAPAAPGTYDIIAQWNPTYFCAQWWNPGNATAIARVTVDSSLPRITIDSPNNNGTSVPTYSLNQAGSPAAYRCARSVGGPDLASCTGTLVNGAPVPTNAVGNQTVTVTAVDTAGKRNVAMVLYRVTYGICVRYDEKKVHNAGSTVPIKLQLCDVRGTNVSAAGITVTANSLQKADESVASSAAAEAARRANRDDHFRYDAELAGYIFNFKTTGLSAGAWKLTFWVDGDPVEHSVQFVVR